MRNSVLIRSGVLFNWACSSTVLAGHGGVLVVDAQQSWLTFDSELRGFTKPINYQANCIMPSHGKLVNCACRSNSCQSSMPALYKRKTEKYTAAHTQHNVAQNAAGHVSQLAAHLNQAYWSPLQPSLAH